MDETYRLNAIVIKRQTFRENDSRVVLYSQEKGKLELVARGTRSIKSKLASHIEPFNLIEAMAVRGRRFDYLGSAISSNCFLGIKESLEKLKYAGLILHLIDKMVKSDEADEGLFELVDKSLEMINTSNEEKSLQAYLFFVFNFFDILGYGSQLDTCILCDQIISPLDSAFDCHSSGLMCADCWSKNKNSTNLVGITDNAIKVLRLAKKRDVLLIRKLAIDQTLQNELEILMQKYCQYQTD